MELKGSELAFRWPTPRRRVRGGHRGDRWSRPTSRPGGPRRCRRWPPCGRPTLRGRRPWPAGSGWAVRCWHPARPRWRRRRPQGGRPRPVLGLGILLSADRADHARPAAGRPVIRVLGGWFPRAFGSVGAMSQRNALRNPRRTGATASALMIGLALVAASRWSARRWRPPWRPQMDKTIGADFIVQNGQGQPFPAEVGNAVAGAKGVGDSSTVRRPRPGPPPTAAPGAGRPRAGRRSSEPPPVSTGSCAWPCGPARSPPGPRRARDVGSAYADDHGLRVGSRVTLRFPDGQRAALTVGAVDVVDPGNRPA